MSEAKKRVLHRYIEEIANQGRYEVAEEIFATGYVQHLTNGRIKNVLKTLQAYRKACPDLHFSIDDLIVEGEKGVIRWTSTGIHNGEWNGIAPTQRAGVVRGVTIVRFVGDKIAETWLYQDGLQMQQHIGVR